MVKDDGEAASPKQTLETPNPDGKILKKVSDVPNLSEPEDFQIGKDMKIGARVSADGGDDMSVTLAELSSKRGGRRGAHQLKDGAKESSKHGDLGLTGEKMENTSGGGDDDSLILRRSGRNKILVDSDESKKLKLIEDGKKGNEEEEVKNSEIEDEDEDEDESEFAVGDFVWGKVKSHPWWPGRVFDPSDASQQALKYKHEGRILVAYFGDATFAWCDESQLKPFVENFAEMSKQSSSKNFVNAVEEAVSEFGRLVELDMTCYCTPRIEHNSNHQGSALNAGIKIGVNVNKGGVGMYSVDRFNPAAFLDDLRDVGKCASVNNLLELTTLRSWVSAVYRSKDGPLLLKFNEMQEAAEDEGVEGMEDSIRGPVEEPVQVMPGMPDSLVHTKRKERSVAEILYGDEKANEDVGVDEAEKSVKTDLKSVRKKRKVADESEKKAHDQEESLGDEILINHQSGKRKKKLEDIAKCETETNYLDKPEDEKKAGRRLSGMKMKESPKPVVVETNRTALEDSEMSPRTRERRKSKYLSPPYTNLEYYRQTAMNSPRGQTGMKTVESSHVSESGETSSKSASAQISWSTPQLVKCSDETFKKNLPTEDGAEHGKPNGSAPGTPKRASSRKVGVNATKSIASSNNVLSGIRSAARSGQLSKGDAVKGFLSSYRSSKYQNESSCNPCDVDNQSGGKGQSSEMVDRGLEREDRNEKKKHERSKVTNKVKKVDIEKDVVQSEVADEGRKNLEKSESKHEKAKLKTKANEVESEKEGLEGRKSLKKSEAKHGKATQKNKANELDPEKDGNIIGTPQSAALHLKFPAGYPLPSKDDLVALYGKFGALDTSKTKISEKFSSARLVFLRGCDAEAACKSSKASSPFGEAEVSYRIRLLKPSSEEKEIDQNGFSTKDSPNLDSQKRKRSSKKQSKASASEGGLRIVKQQLEVMSTMVAEAGNGKMSSEMKLNLESRLKDLLDEVKALPSLHSSSGSGV